MASQGYESAISRRLRGFAQSVMPSQLSPASKLFLAGGALNGFSNGVFNSILQLYLVSQGFSALSLGKVFLFNPLASVLFSIPVGLLADRYGKRPFIVLGMVFASVGIGGFLLSQTLSGYAVSFFLFGVCNATFTVLAPLYTGFHRREDLDKAFGLYGLVNLFAMSLGNLGGTIPPLLIRELGLTEYLAYRQVLLVASPLFIAQYFCYLASTRGLAETRNKGFQLRLQSWRTVLEFCFIFFAINLVGGIFFGLFPYYVHSKFGVSSGELGSLFFLSNFTMALSNGLASMVSSKLGTIKSAALGIGLSSLFFFLMPLSPSFQILAVFYLARTATRFMSDPLLTSIFMRSVGKEELSTANSMRTISMNLAGMFSPWLGGLLMEQVSLDAPAFIGAGLTLILSLIYPLVLRDGED